MTSGGVELEQAPSNGWNKVRLENEADMSFMGKHQVFDGFTDFEDFLKTDRMVIWLDHIDEFFESQIRLFIEVIVSSRLTGGHIGQNVRGIIKISVFNEIIGKVKDVLDDKSSEFRHVFLNYGFLPFI